MVELTKESLEGLRPSKKFTENSGFGPTANLDFDSTGEYLITTCPADDSILLYNCVEGEVRKVIYSKKYGVGQIKFAHRSTTVIYSSTKGEDEAIRYLSLHDNKYLRYFRGHHERVNQLLLNPLNDTFISVAPDEALCMWDLRTAHMQGRLNLSPKSSAIAAFDPQGLVFAVATASRFLRLYDARNWDRGAFATFELNSAVQDAENAATGTWGALQFSPDGKDLLIASHLTPNSLTSATPVGFVVDSFDGNVRGVLEYKSSNQDNLGLRYTAALQFTPDGQFILGGRSDGNMSIWKRPTSSDSTLPLIESIEGIGRDPIKDVAFNPKYAMLATAGEATVFYI